jgi:hypothetical protein
MIDSTTKNKVVAVLIGNQISIKLYSWGGIAALEDHLFDELGIEIDSFKPIKDEDGKEIGSELIYEFKDIDLIQSKIDQFEVDPDY